MSSKVVHRNFFLFTVLALWAWCCPLEAQRLSEGGLDLHMFRPAVDSKGHISVNGSEILGANDFSFGLILDAGFGILPFHGFASNDTRLAADADRRGQIVDQFYTGTLHFNYGIANMLVVGAQLPVQVISGKAVEVPGIYNTGSPSGLGFQGIGNVTLHGKVRILRADRNPVGVAGILHIQLPTGNPKAFAGDPGFALWPVGVVEWRPYRRLRFSGNVGYRWISGKGSEFLVNGRTCPMGTDPSMASCPLINPAVMGSATGAQLVPGSGHRIRYDDLLTFGFGASFRVFDSLDLVGEVYGTQIVKEFGTPQAFSMEALGGLKIFVQRNSYLLLGAGAGLPPRDTFHSADIRGVLGFVFEPSIGDRDGDGLKDDYDQCPDQPEDFDNFEDEDGCPEPDNDRDGILDEDDECPLVPEDHDGDADEDGCPEGNESDRDGDGILDDVDECPDEPEDKDGFQDQDGCPDPDNDEDGILDVNDLCPNDAEDKDGFQDEDGCPDNDNDSDRILDNDDHCPNEPETRNGFEDQDGCPDQGQVVIEGNDILILEKIYFETDSAVILPQSFGLLDQVAGTLIGNPQIKLIEVQGHADQRGADPYNLRLTRDRAASVVEALIERGVTRDRLRSAGYGERCPVDPSNTPAAWEKNRRVEFKIIETEDGPTGVQVACPAGRDLIPR